MADTDDRSPALKRRIRRSALTLAAVAFLFFVGFIAVTALRS